MSVQLVHLYKLVILLYPPSVRREFGAEMLELAKARADKCRARGGRFVAFRSWWILMRDSFRAIPEAHAASLRNHFKHRGSNELEPRLSVFERMMLVLGDLRFALRSLNRSRGFALAAILTLALGIGANTAIFSVVNGVILKPLPFHDPDELVSIGTTRPERGSTMGAVSQPDLRDVQSQIGAIEHAAGYSESELTLTGMGDAEAVRGAHVTDGLLNVFQEAPYLGRDIRTEENIPDGPRVVMIGHAFWQERLGGRGDILGETILLDGTPHEIVGVAPPGFDYPRNAQLWIPLHLDVEDCDRGCHLLGAVGRLANGSTAAIARSELSALSLRLQEQYPDNNYAKFIDLITMEEDVVGDVRTALLVLLGAVGMVLLIAYANVANLLLARASVRAGEVAMRSALGAGRGRLVQQLLLEAVVLASVAGVAGVALATVGVSALLRLAPSSIPRLDNVGVDALVLLFAVATVILVTILFGLVPALRLAKTPVATVLNQSGRGGAGAATQDWSRSALLVAEVAFSLMLLFGAGLLLRSFSQLNAVELGFERDRVLTFRLSLPEVPYDDDGEATVRFFETLEERVAALPGVERVGSAFGSAFGGNMASATADFLDRPAPPEGQEDALLTRIVTPRYHETLRVPLIRGRGIERTDRNGVPRAAIVSQSLVDRYYPNKDPIGQQIRIHFGWAFGAEEPWNIVGVVGDIRSRRVTSEPQPEVYVSHAQMGALNMSVLVRLAPGAPVVLPLALGGALVVGVPGDRGAGPQPGASHSEAVAPDLGALGGWGAGFLGSLRADQVRVERRALLGHHGRGLLAR